MRCAFVPLNPNELTPARRGPGVAGQGVGRVGTVIGIRSHGMKGLGRRKCRWGGISPRRTARIARMSPATPAADSRWPMADFTDEIISGRSGGRSGPNTSARDCTSIGSPSAVPVPCAST